MRLKRNLFFSIVAIALVGLMLVILSGDNGLMDLIALRIERDRVVESNEKTFNENIALYRQIERLKSDPRFVAAMVRKELNLVGEDELVFTFK